MSRTVGRTLAVLVTGTALVAGFLAWAFLGRGEGPSTAPAADPVPEPPARTVGRRNVYPYGRVVVLAIGVNRYPHLTGAADLRFAENDARAFTDLVRSHYGYETELLLGPDATKAGIAAALKRCGGDLGEDDAFIVYFAGHGQVIETPEAGEAGYLLPADARLDMDNRTDPTRWAEQALDMRFVTESLDGVPARHTLLIADACCSGFLTGRGSLERWDLKTFLAGRSRAVVTATTKRQLAREDVDAKHGYFTATLLDELRRDDAASVHDVFLPVLKAVSAKTNGQMTPQAAQLEGDGLFVFVPRSIPREEIERDLADAAAGTLTRDRGLSGAAKREADRTRQRTTPAEVMAAFEAHDYRFSADAEDRRILWEGRFERFQRNAALGDVWAMAGLHFCYAKGLGTEKNAGQALHWARQADRVRNPVGVGRYLLGRCYEYGLGVSPAGAGLEQARRLYRESAAAGFGLGLRASALLALREGPDAETAGRAKKMLEDALTAGIPAEVELAHTLLPDGPKSLPRDAAAAVKLIEQAAARDNPWAHRKLFWILTEGAPGYPAKDLERAGRHLHRAAELGLPDALNELAAEYNGDAKRLGLKPDPRRAYELCDRAALQGDGDALAATAKWLAEGKVVPADHALARARLAAAVKAGSSFADLVEGWWYLDGTVYARSHPAALAAFRRAADKGSVGGCLDAAFMLRDGRGFEPKNAARALLVTFHDDLHHALHYAAKALKAGVGHPGDRANCEMLLEVVKNYLPGGDYAGGGGLGPLFGGGGGRPATAKELADRGFEVIEAGDAVRRAKAVVGAWKKDHPDTFAYFCERWWVDAKTLSVKPPADRKAPVPGGK